MGDENLKVLINSPRMSGRNIKTLLWFLDEGKKDKSVILATS